MKDLSTGLGYLAVRWYGLNHTLKTVSKLYTKLVFTHIQLRYGAPERSVIGLPPFHLLWIAFSDFFNDNTQLFTVLKTKPTYGIII